LVNNLYYNTYSYVYIIQCYEDNAYTKQMLKMTEPL